MLLFALLPPLLITAGPAERPRVEVLREAARPLAAEFYATTDPEPSFDARRVLFSGKRSASDRWQIYEITLATGRSRQITSGEEDSRFPAYQSRFFTLDAPTPWDQVVFVRSGQLHTCTLEGKDCHPITFHEAGARAGPPSVAWDGRVIYPLSAGGQTRLFAVNLDGTDVALFSGTQADGGRVAADSEFLYVTHDGKLRRLSLLRPSLKPLDLPLEALDPEVLPGGEVLAAKGNTLMMVVPESGVWKVVYRSSQALRQPRALARRTPPDGRGSVVDPAVSSGVLYCLSAWTSERPEAAKAKYVRIHVAGREASTTALAPDGSFHLRLPANTPVSVETLDEKMKPILRSSPFWVRNKENRGCIGCHENPELSPENRFAEALRRPAVEMTTGNE